MATPSLEPDMRWPGLQPIEDEPPPVAPADFTEGRLVYAVGDVHGRLDLLAALVEEIAADARVCAPAEPPLLVLVGDYVDRGPDSRGVVEALVALSRDSRFQVEALRGNHEAAMLGFLQDAQGGPEWASWGGNATLASYGVAAPAPHAPPQAWETAQAALAAAVPQAHLALLKGLPLSLMVGGYLFVHAGVRPGAPLGRQEPQDLLMIRKPFLKHARPLGRVVVHGHTPGAEPYVSPVRIGIDTGAYATGVLTAARLMADDVRFIQARAATAAGRVRS